MIWLEPFNGRIEITQHFIGCKRGFDIEREMMAGVWIFLRYGVVVIHYEASSPKVPLSSLLYN